jgi:hypothetical protein
MDGWIGGWIGGLFDTAGLNFFYCPGNLLKWGYESYMLSTSPNCHVVVPHGRRLQKVVYLRGRLCGLLYRAVSITCSGLAKLSLVFLVASASSNCNDLLGPSPSICLLVLRIVRRSPSMVLKTKVYSRQSGYIVA